jgi:hypothetical protein
MLASGRLNWPIDAVQGFLMQGATFNAAHLRLSQAGGTKRGTIILPQRSVRSSDGAFMGSPVSFSSVAAGVNFSLVLAKEDGSLDPWLISFYDEDTTGSAFHLTTPGSITIRPVGSDPVTPGVWLDF